MAKQKSDTTTYTPVELKLLIAAEAVDLPAILDIVSRLTINERETIVTDIYDTALHSIVSYAEVDQAESAYATMMFIRAVGRYISPEAVSASLQASPRVPQRRYTDNVHQLHAQPATGKSDDSGLRRRDSDHETLHSQMQIPGSEG
jgi:hypothetical protein